VAIAYENLATASVSVGDYESAYASLEPMAKMFAELRRRSPDDFHADEDYLAALALIGRIGKFEEDGTSPGVEELHSKLERVGAQLRWTIEAGLISAAPSTQESMAAARGRENPPSPLAQAEALGYCLEGLSRSGDATASLANDQLRESLTRDVIGRVTAFAASDDFDPAAAQAVFRNLSVSVRPEIRQMLKFDEAPGKQDLRPQER
jgi:hypothetical protein